MQKVIIFEHASRESLKEYSRYKRRGLPLKCPCNYSFGKEALWVVKVLSTRLVLLQPVNHPSHLTIAIKDDLKNIESEEK